MTEVTAPAAAASPPLTGHETGLTTDTTALDSPAGAELQGNAESLGLDAPAAERERVRDPNLSVLQGMFPDFDETVLQSVLDSVGGNSDRAIDVLLGMSDPEYRSDHRPNEQPSQEELDAQFARQLYMEDQQQADWQAQQQQQQQRPPRPTFSGRRASASQEPERDTMTEISDQFNKIAESGKRTFGNIFSKVKAKIAELDQPRPETSSSSYPTEAAYPTTQQHRHQRMQQVQQTAQARQYEQQQQQQLQLNQQPAYYDPNSTSESPPSSAGGYDVTPSPHIESTTPRTPPASSGIDAGKLGLLPKRPVSLFRAASPTASPTPVAGRHDSNGDDMYADDEPEPEHTAEDPFDDARAEEREQETAGTVGATKTEPV
ncbi:hypothetical protein BDP27DRAFT_1422575 [Rhodocollybia butyracea]|uniref:CUE domain-containing protein n=1 Tax=Rhodocollybia butyracea TaxID=206335 RepID=A0A9P5PTJ4_9AGAR|nr:hypothetical protein BDP27DRAFT_1422575 [Rhodocollybia butyracea]